MGRADLISLMGGWRLASKLDGRFQYLGGLFYEDVKEGMEQISYLMPGAPNPLGTDPLQHFTSSRDRNQGAVFGEVSYDLTKKLTATVGGRYFDYDKKDTTVRDCGFYRTPCGTAIPVFVEGSEGDTSYKANLNYKPTEDSLLYLSWSQGFRLGRPTSGLPPSCDINNDGLIDGTSVTIASARKINSDHLDNYEIGAKFMLFDRRMVVDTSVYHINWDGLPISVRADACALSYTANAGAATSDGVESQFALLLGGGLRLDFGAGYTHARLAEDAPALRARAGARLPGSPKVSANLAAQYDFTIAEYNAFVRADSFYVGPFYGDLLQSPLTRAGEYIKVDARAGVAIKNLRVEVFARNLTNQDAFTWRGLSNANTSFGYRLRPRTIGIQLGYSFE
jgi:iron complex outermembrane receptor protein